MFYLLQNADIVQVLSPGHHEMCACDCGEGLSSSYSLPRITVHELLLKYDISSVSRTSAALDCGTGVSCCSFGGSCYNGKFEALFFRGNFCWN